MTTINISLPEQLKNQADAAIKDGYYASFSDLVRSALRTMFTMDKYDRMAKQSLDEYRKGKSTVLRTSKDIDAYVNSIVKEAKK